MHANTNREMIMMPKQIQLEVKPAEHSNQYWGAAIINGTRKPFHLLEIGTDGELRTVGGNPARYFAPIDPLWWLEFWQNAPSSIIITGELKQA